MDVTGSARDYISWDPNQECRKEVQSLLDSGRVEELEAILSSRLAFGTAGLRGPMGAGYNRMNELVVLQTSQGLVKYLESVGANNKVNVSYYL